MRESTFAVQNYDHPADAASPGRPSNTDLLIYMGDLVAELQAMAAHADMESLADLLAYMHRDVERRRLGR